MSKLADKVFFITGASGGIGEAMAREAAQRGARVVLTARRVDRLERIVSEIQQEGGQATCAACDVTEPEQLRHAVSKAREVFGGIDVVIANAGFGVQGTVASLTVEDYRRQFECNVFGVLNTLYATLESLRERRGAIGVVGSANGYVNLPTWSAYCMSKHAVRSLCACLRHELSAEGVSVTHLAPGLIASDFRRTSNQNVLDAGSKEPVPAWLMMPPSKAAKKMIAAVVKRRSEAVITAHAKALIDLERHLPTLVSGVVGLTGEWVRRLSKNTV
jgi:short-subunit dehydrogenase